MNCLVIGYGSIGHRHAAVLAELGLQVHLVTKRDAKDYPCYRTIGEALEKKRFDYVVISCETSDHYRSFQTLNSLGYSGKLLIEKPVFSELPSDPQADSNNVFVAYNLRFHPIIQKLRELFYHKKPYSIQVYAGQYLPSWRPDADYTKCYSSSRARGGGVLKDLSHELDYINWIAGPWKRVAAIGGKFSELTIDSDDVFSLLIETEHCPVVSVQLNYLDLIARREIIVNLQDFSVRADLIAGTMDVNGEITRYESERNMTYTLQHKAILDGDYSSVCTFEEGIDTLKLIHAAGVASEKRVWVERSAQDTI